MVYWITLLILLATAFICNVNFRTINGKSLIYGKKVYVCIASFLLVFLASMRSLQVGKDTNMYHTLFIYMSNIGSFKAALKSWQRGGVEILYAVMEYVFSHKANFQIFLSVASIISIVPVMIVIYKYSKNYFMSLFLYIAFGYFSFSMNGIRQSIAIGICMLAYMAARNQNLIQYFILIVIACLFHSSAIIFLPVFWLSKIKITRKTIIIYLGLVLVMNIFKARIFSFMNLFSRQTYEGTAETGGRGMYLFILFILAAMLIWRKEFIENNKNRDDNMTLLSMFSIAALLWPIASLNTAVFRLYYYYHIFMIFAVPAFLDSLKDSYAKVILYLIFIIVGIYYLKIYIIGGELLYSPYSFFWQ